MRNMTRTLIVIGMAATNVSNAIASDDDTGAWAILSTSNSIYRDGQETDWRYGFDTQFRHFNRGNGSNQYVLRPSIGYVLQNKVSLWAGYGYFLTDPDGGSSRHEHRWWQQVQLPARQYERFSLTLRTRLEERVIENADDTGLRLRQQFQAAAPIGNGELSLILSLEPFFNLRDTDAGARSGFDQNRTYAGIRMPLANSASLEAGYMHQYINRSGAEDAVNHLGMLHLRVKF